ncbi:MAG: RloB domain-containing protein [Mariprofundaceae bacterium]|nr:RloB domain-containing protein [Mariprofundaceae bacterium]
MVSQGRKKLKREPRRTKPTVLFVGEGKTEVAFIKHLKRLYQPERNPPIRIDVENGKDSGQVLRTALKITAMKQYDVVVCLFDLDKVLPKGDMQRAKSKKFVLIGASPCIEGFMLDILEKAKPHHSSECKYAMHPLLAGKETDSTSYALFSKDLLACHRKTSSNLDVILTLIESGKCKDSER